jgi:hypothetical protein
MTMQKKDINVLPEGVKRPSGVKTNEIFTIKIEISPTLAEKWLGKNKNNRRVRNSHVDFIAYEIESSKWKVNGETIKFDWFGNLLDGQHRLSGIVKAGKSVESYVTIGLDPEDYKTIDTGKSRDAKDVLKMAGYGYDSYLSSITKFVIEYQSGKFKALGKSYANIYDNQDILNFVKKHYTQLEKCIDFHNKVYSHSPDKLITGKIAGGYYYLMSKISEVDAIDFLSKLLLGTNLGDKNDPIWQLRKKLTENKNAMAKLPQHVICLMINKTWNYYRNKQTVSYIKIIKDEEIQELK